MKLPVEFKPNLCRKWEQMKLYVEFNPILCRKMGANEIISRVRTIPVQEIGANEITGLRSSLSQACASKGGKSHVTRGI